LYKISITQSIIYGWSDDRKDFKLFNLRWKTAAKISVRLIVRSEALMERHPYWLNDDVMIGP